LPLHQNVVYSKMKVYHQYLKNQVLKKQCSQNGSHVIELIMKHVNFTTQNFHINIFRILVKKNGFQDQKVLVLVD
jgi:hypothetical protein